MGDEDNRVSSWKGRVRVGGRCAAAGGSPDALDRGESGLPPVSFGHQTGEERRVYALLSI